MAEEKETIKKEEQKIDTPKKSAPKKQAAPKPLVHVNEFIDAISMIKNLTNIQKAGFRAYMANDQYKEKMDDFTEPLNKYLGK